MRFGGLIAAVIFAAVAAVVVLKMSGNNTPAPTAAAPQAPQAINAINIYVAKTPISVGSTITEEMVTSQPWPEHLALEGFMRTDNKEAPIVGMVARSPFQQGEPMISSKLANPNDPNFLAGDLPAGMRVITIPVNEIDGLAGFVFPGDHVDIIYTHDVAKWVSPPAAVSPSSGAVPEKTHTTVTETLLTNVKVLAVDQRASGTGATDKNGNLIIPRSASLMVSQADSQRVRLAQKTGTLSLVLRALADKESSDPLVLTKSNDISQDKQEDGVSADGSVKIVRGAPVVIKETESSGIARGASQATGLQLPPLSNVNSGSVTAP